MQETEQDSHTPDEKQNKKTTKKLPLILSAIFIVLLAAGVYGTYAWQHQKVVDAQNQQQETAKELKETKNSLKNAQDEYAQLNTEYETLVAGSNKEIPTQKDLELKIDRAISFSSGDPLFNYVAVGITLTNNTDGSVSVAANAYKLKDADNHTYNGRTISSNGLGPEYVNLQEQVLAPGESVSGTVEFVVKDSSVKNYQLVIGTKSYEVNT